MLVVSVLKIKGVCVPRTSALGPLNVGRLNTIPLFNFEVVITLKL